MACSLTAPSHCLIQRRLNINWTLLASVKFQLKYKHFHSKNAFENIVLQMSVILFRLQCINSLWPIDAIWWNRSGSAWVQVMTCCPTAPRHYLNKVDLSLVRPTDIHLRALSQDILQPPIIKLNWILLLLIFTWNLPRANEFNFFRMALNCF